MRFESFRNQSDRRLCAECINSGSDCTSCTHHEKPTIAAVPAGYDYSHLVCDPAMRNCHTPATVSFDEWLTPQDRIFLEFVLRIAL
jgi:hypothetical protein